MTTLRAICTACAPESLARSPHLPTAPRKVLSAIQQCQSGPYGHSLSPCPTWGGHHRVNHACGHRHGPPCPQQTTQQCLQHHLDNQLPGPHCLMTCTVPATLRPCIRSPHRPASQALLQASAPALKRLAHDERFLGTALPGFPGGLHPWGRQLPYHPPIHNIVPGGGLSQDRTTWGPARATCFGPVKALAPISRALCKDEMRHAGWLEPSDPQGWPIPGNGHSQAKHHAHSACTSRAPYVFRGAIAHRRLVSLQDRTVTFPSRQVGRACPRPAHLDGMELLRRFLHHVWPDGFMKVRHFGLLPASCAVPLAPIRLLLVPGHPGEDTPPPRKSPPPRVARCPTCGVALSVVRRLWTSPKALVDTS